MQTEIARAQVLLLLKSSDKVAEDIMAASDLGASPCPTYSVHAHSSRGLRAMCESPASVLHTNVSAISRANWLGAVLTLLDVGLLACHA